MNPVDRFTEHATRALGFSVEEAERQGAGYHGAEHLLLGLLRGECLAARALASLGVTHEAVRSELAGVVREALPEAQAQRPISTESVKKVCELASQVADEMGQRAIGTEHLLLGLLAEGKSVAVHVLRALGADHDSVRAQVERLLGESGEVSTVRLPRPANVDPVVLDDAADLAWAEGAQVVSHEHVRMAMDDDRQIKTLIRSIRDIERRRQDAVDGRDVQAATRLRAEGQRLGERLREAMAAWRSRQA
ncbi:MAG TPA: Clp protease N-terminal domain-containing protein [Candidatus Dormibacteraeota bacterium]|jgi:ATP-dependent Clp protease ATP-binding subunit ClpC